MRKHTLHQELRSGITTGTCAAAVAKAATYMLVHQESIEHVQVALPSGNTIYLDLHGMCYKRGFARCGTIKDAGDDPDATHKAEIIAEVSYTDGDRVELEGGTGIGTVTKPGLLVPVGAPAINPVPYRMIVSSVKEVLPNHQGVRVVIHVPKGEEIAKRTFNPQLGIVGGISLLGTTGIVKPMSEDALKESLVLSLSQQATIGKEKAIFAPGNYGKTFSEQRFQFDPEKVILTSNYIGFMMERAVKYRFKKIVLVGHIGKLVKLAAGIFQTHSRTADARNETLASHYLEYSRDVERFYQLMKANTTEEATDIIEDRHFWSYLATQIKARAERYIYQEIEIEVVLFSQTKGMLGHSVQALEMMEEICSET